MRRGTRQRMLFAIVLVAIGPAVVPALISQSVTQSSARPPRLFKDSRQALAIARAQGRRDAVLLVAAVPGGAAAVAARAAALGGDVRYRDDNVDYLRIRIPIDRATEFAEFDRIESAAMNVDDSYPMRLGPATAQNAVPVEPGGLLLQPDQTQRWPPKWDDYPLRHAYSPIKDLGAAELLAKHPTYDGRGVTIAVLDGNLDLLLPEFQTAYALDGKTVPKIADFLNVTDPRDDLELMPQWVNMRDQATAAEASLTYQGKTFTTPRDGTFRIGYFNERRFNVPSNAAYIDQDVDRNGNPRGDDGLFGVLWDEKTNDVWVDTDRDLSFTDERAMTDYIKRQDVGVFGQDDPKTPVRDTIGFAVQTDPQNKFVSINLGIYQHATGILGSVVGNKEPKGRLSGVAPGARIVSVFYGTGIAHALVEGLIAAFKHPLVDLIVLEQSVNIASIPYLLADGRHPISVIAERLTARHQKLMFVPGSNSPGFGIVAEDGLAPTAISVGGYQSKESYRLNAGFIPEPDDNLHWGALSHGPSGIGALKPDLIAPSGQMSTDPGYRKGDVKRGLYQLPPGYSVDGGTSTATPMAAGATALVLSAAKQEKVPYDAARLKAALVGSARQIPRLAAHEQGNGLIQVGAALELLKKRASTTPIAITSRGPVRTKLSHLLALPHTGVGLYEREGWKPGDRGTREITFTRTSGPAEPMTFSLDWLGNDGTFSTRASLALPLNRPTTLPIEIAVKDAGAHTAILTLTHPSVPGPVYRVMHAIVAPVRLSAENKFAVTTEVTVPRPGDRGIFVDVPAGGAALTFSQVPPPPSTPPDTSAGTIRLNAISPSREYLYSCPPTLTPGSSCVVARPEPGVWEINVANNMDASNFDPDRPEPVAPNATKVNVALAAFEVTTPAAPAERPTAGSAVPLTLTLRNRFASKPAAATAAALGSAFQDRRTIARGEQHMFVIDVPKGASSIAARIAEVAGAGADLDLYLLDCSRPEKKEAETAPPERDKGNKAPTAMPAACAPRAKASTADRDGEVEVLDPAPGRWVVIVDAFAIPSGSTTYSYLDLFTHPRFGTIAVTDTLEPRDWGRTWTTDAHLWVASLPDAPRRLYGRVGVTSREIRTSQSLPISLGALDLFTGGARPTSPSSSGGIR